MIKTINALYVEPGEEPERMRIRDELSAYQTLVEGPIETIRLDDETILICNEEGHIRNMSVNRFLISNQGTIDAVIAGPFVIVRAEPYGEEFESLTAKQVKKYEKTFSTLECYIWEA